MEANRKIGAWLDIWIMLQSEVETMKTSLR